MNVGEENAMRDAQYGFGCRLAGTVLAALLAAGTGRVQAAELWNYYIHQSAPQFATSRGAQMLADEVQKLSGGEFKVRRHLAGTLQINVSNITQAVADNVVQMGDDLFFSGNIPVGSMLRLPFLVQSYEDYDKASAVLMPYVEKAYAAKGITVLAAYTYPNQYPWGRKPIGSLADISGQKLRIASPEQGEFVRRFGGTSVSLGAPEVPSALDRGVVDGLITGTVGAVLWKDLLKYGYLLGLNFNNAYIVANTAAFSKLTPDEQAKLRQAAQDSAKWNTETMKADDADDVKRLKESNFVIAEPTDADRQKAATAMEPYWNDWAKEHGPDTVEALAKVRAALGR
jgi:TRAP-type C4-dicarboxylate transport system substrate-binding protein